MPTDFILPELGENITSGDVLRILVKPGDMLSKDQPVLELETDKATIEVPSSVAGEVADIKVKAGDTVKVGQAILSVVDAGKAPDQAAPAPSPPKSEAAAPARIRAASKRRRTGSPSAVTPDSRRCAETILQTMRSTAVRRGRESVGRAGQARRQGTAGPEGRRHQPRHAPAGRVVRPDRPAARAGGALGSTDGARTGCGHQRRGG